MPDGTAVHECRLTNDRGTQADILTLGATLRALTIGGAGGVRDDIVLGFDDGTKRNLVDLYTINQDILRQLPDAPILDLFRRG